MSGAKGGNRGGRISRGDGGEGVCGGGGEFRYCLQNVGGVGTGASEVLADHVLELLESTRLNVQLPIEILAHLALHLVDLAEGKHALADDAPGLVGVGVVADDLACDHEGGNEEAVARGALGGGEVGLEALEEVEGSDRVEMVCRYLLT